jgi:predicted lipid-binding transport protein (Tim44 family)
MKSFFVLITAIATAAALAFAGVADAKRLGSGRSLGMQRQVSPPTQSAPVAPTRPGAASDPVMPPAQPGAAMPRTAAPATATAPAAPASGMSRWLGPIAGIAAGLGLAALMSHLGLSDAFGGVLLLGLIAIAGIFLVRRFLLPRTAARPTAAGVNTGVFAPFPPQARETRVEPTLAASAAATTPSLPPGFEPEPFLQQAKLQFRRLQAAYDAGDRTMLADVMTPEFFAEVSRELDLRGDHVPTEVVALNAQILEVVTEARKHIASVKFNGLVREDGAAQPQPFIEIWNLTKPVDGKSGWLLAGIQQAEEPLTLQ